MNWIRLTSATYEYIQTSPHWNPSVISTLKATNIETSKIMALILILSVSKELSPGQGIS